MFNVNSGKVGETTDNNSDDSRCNIDEDDEKVISSSPQNKLKESATFAALKPDTEKIQQDLLLMRHHFSDLN